MRSTVTPLDKNMLKRTLTGNVRIGFIVSLETMAKKTNAVSAQHILER